MTPQLWQGVSGSPVGEQRLMLAAAQQGMTATVRMWDQSYIIHLLCTDRVYSVCWSEPPMTRPQKQDLPS